MNFLKVGTVLTILSSMAAAGDDRPATGKVVLAIHGGVGTMDRAKIKPEEEEAYRKDLEQALRAGYAVIEKGGTSLDAVAAAIIPLEDSPRFNAGKGAVFTHDGRNELDASIMDGRTGMAGAVAGVTTIKNPILGARAVMDKSPHVLMVGAGADQFAKEAGLTIVDPSYFRTEHRWKELQRMIEEEKKAGKPVIGARHDPSPHLGTVGAVALDHKGHLAAGTSTGGRANKRYGRVGDSPIIGAGTFAEDGVAAVSATGQGEFFIRHVVAHDIAARVKYKGSTAAEAADTVIHRVLKSAGAEGGVIVLDVEGRASFSFNTEGMYRGYVTEDGKTHVAIFKD